MTSFVLSELNTEFIQYTASCTKSPLQPTIVASSCPITHSQSTTAHPGWKLQLRVRSFAPHTNALQAFPAITSCHPKLPPCNFLQALRPHICTSRVSIFCSLLANTHTLPLRCRQCRISACPNENHESFEIANQHARAQYHLSNLDK
jgi:hypothetical protein